MTGLYYECFRPYIPNGCGRASLRQGGEAGRGGYPRRWLAPLLLTPLLSFSLFLTFATHNLPHSHTGRVGHPRRRLYSWSLTHSHEYSYTRILLWNPASFTHFIHEQRSCSSGNGDGHFAMRCDTDVFWIHFTIATEFYLWFAIIEFEKISKSQLKLIHNKRP